MKIKYKILSVLCLVVLLCSAWTLPGQTNLPPTLGTELGHILSLRNPAIQQTNDITVTIGDGIRTEADATYQATVVHALKSVKDNLSIGVRLELDTLGTGGNTVAGFSAGMEARYETDNLFVSGIAGYHRDVDDATRSFEAGIGLGAYITPNLNVCSELLLGYTGKSGNEGLEHAFVVTANYSF